MALLTLNYAYIEQNWAQVVTWAQETYFQKFGGDLELTWLDLTWTPLVDLMAATARSRY